MPLQKQTLTINFAQGIDTKADPFQVAPGRFLSLENTVFDKGGLLQKRNGYGSLATLADADTSFITTFKGNLTAIGDVLRSYSDGTNTWVDKGILEPVSLSVMPVVRSNTSQSYADSAISANNYICTVFTDNIPVGGVSTVVYKYVILDKNSGENIVSPVIIAGCTTSPKVFLLGSYFIIVFNKVISATNHLQYIAINTTTLIAAAPSDISAQHTPAATGDFDGAVVNNRLYLAWNGSDGGGAIRITYLDSLLVVHSPVVFSGYAATLMSVAADITRPTPVIYVSFYNLATSRGYTLALDQNLSTLFTPVQIITIFEPTRNLTSAAKDGVLTFFYEIRATYPWGSSEPTHFIRKNTVTEAGVVGILPSTLARSVGVASKAFYINSRIYLLSVYSSTYQPTYFLLNDAGAVVAKLAYSNGGSYFTTGLPGVFVSGTTASISYLIKDLIQAVNKTQGAANSAGIYSQTGVNLVDFNIHPDINAAEIGSNLNISGGIMWAYDGYLPVEHGFHLWPDYVDAATSSSGGSMTNQEYYYAATYEWSDNQGNIFRSAPSIPVLADLSGGSPASNKVTVSVPTLRLTRKIANPVKIVLYRWSAGQPVYYQTTSISIPVLNDVTVDYITIEDTQADSAILGNNILYTTGGVVENIAPPAVSVMSLFKSRLFIVNAEDENLLWYSKQVIEKTPVEMSDLFTIYVAPTIGAQGDTGGIKALAAMDDKLVIFKKNAIYYIVGNGPDNTGSNNDFSEPVFITSVVGSINQKSIVFMPNGLMFQSDKGIWLLARDLSTNYIGAPAEALTIGRTVQSAVNIPGANQVRFTLDSGITLMYDYFYGQWGTFTEVPAISSTLYEDLHTYVDSSGQVFQETPGAYLDGSDPVLISFKTSWFNLAGLQGFERAYFFYLLASYKGPHKLEVQVAYDYDPSPSQSLIISPDNYSPTWGTIPFWGSEAWGGESALEQWRIFFKQQKCQSFQITINELFDPTLDIAPTAGLTISGLNLVAGMKKGYTPIKAARSIGK